MSTKRSVVNRSHATKGSGQFESMKHISKKSMLIGIVFAPLTRQSQLESVVPLVNHDVVSLNKKVGPLHSKHKPLRFVPYGTTLPVGMTHTHTRARARTSSIMRPTCSEWP